MKEPGFKTAWSPRFEFKGEKGTKQKGEKGGGEDTCGFQKAQKVQK